MASFSSTPVTKYWPSKSRRSVRSRPPTSPRASGRPAVEGAAAARYSRSLRGTTGRQRELGAGECRCRRVQVQASAAAAAGQPALTPRQPAAAPPYWRPPARSQGGFLQHRWVQRGRAMSRRRQAAGGGGGGKFAAGWVRHGGLTCAPSSLWWSTDRLALRSGRQWAGWRGSAECGHVCGPAWSPIRERAPIGALCGARMRGVQ